MPAPDRLAELRRQRALLQDHLAWLDREIAAAERSAPAATAAPAPGEAKTPVAAPVSSAAELRKPAASQTDSEAEAILSEYRAAGSDLQRDVRQGCLLYFVGAFAVLAAVVAILWFALRR